MAYAFILYEVRGHVAIITINRPKVMNSLHAPAWRELTAAYAEADADPAVRVIVATGAGDRAFSTGWDLNEASEITSRASDPAFDLEAANADSDTFYRGLRTWKPVIAAVNGYCVAGGLEYALMCDIVVAAEHAQFGLQEVRWAILPGGGGTQRLPRKIPVNIAAEAILTGDRFDAAAALRYGLANHVVAADQVMPKALEIANTIAKRGPLAVRNAKRAIVEGLDETLAGGMAREHALSHELMLTEDAKEGPRAFLEKREPRYEGR